MGKFQNTSQILLSLLFIFSATFILSQSIQAKCAPTSSIDEEFRRAESVFVGEVTKKTETSITKNRRSYRGTIFTFSVAESFKGEQKSSIDVKSFAVSSESYFDFKEGEKYLVYAWKNPQNKDLMASGCTRTKLYSVANEEVIGVRLISYLNGNGWMKINPAISNRSDVENIFGKCGEVICFYETDLGGLIVSFNSKSFCNGEKRDSLKEKVFSVTFLLKNDIILKNIPLDLKQFTEHDDPDIAGLGYFDYKEKTLVLNASKSAEKDGNLVYAFRFLPSESQKKLLKCEGK